MTEEEKKKKAHARSQKRYSKRNRRDVLKAQTDRAKLMKLDVFIHYSNGKLECACCAEDTYLCLCLDHIDSDW